MKNSRLTIMLCLSALCLLFLVQFPHATTHAGLAETPTTNRLADIANRTSQNVKAPDTLAAKVSDFDGNGFADLAVCLPGAPNIWYVKYVPGLCTSTSCLFYLHGTSADTLVPGDYTLDLSTNFTVYQPTGTFSVGIDSPPPFPFPFFIPTFPPVQWGTLGDTPLSGDFVGSNAADYVVVRSIAGALHWYILENPSGPASVYVFGIDTDELVPGDYDGDGKTDITVFRAATGTWYSRSSMTGAVTATNWGTIGDIPLLGNFDATLPPGTGNTKDDIAVYRPSTGYFYILNSHSPFLFQFWQFYPTDIPVPADYDNDGDADIAVFEQTTNEWHIFPSPTVVFGLPGNEIPVPATYVKCLPVISNSLCP
jgi:hypothetical protein